MENVKETIKQILPMLNKKYTYWQLYMIANEGISIREISRISGVAINTLRKIKKNTEDIVKIFNTKNNTEIDTTKSRNINKKQKTTDTKINTKIETEILKIPYIRKELLDDFIKMRKSIKKPMTERAIEMLVNKLVLLDSEGYDANKLLSLAIERCWLSVYAHESCLKEGEEIKITEDDERKQDEYMKNKYNVDLDLFKGAI